MLIVLLGGGGAVAIGVTMLFFAFRGFGGAKAGKSSHMALIVALLAFVFLCCAVLLVVAYREL